MKRKKYSLIFISFLFLLIYTPPIINHNILHIIGPLTWIYILANHKSMNYHMNFRRFLTVCVQFLIASIYCLCMAVLNDNSLYAAINFFYCVLYTIPAGFVAAHYIKKKDYTICDLFNVLLIAGTIQGILALTAFIFKPFQDFYINRLLEYGFESVYESMSDIRVYGFAIGLTFSVPIVQAILAVIALYLSSSVSWKYCFFIPLLIFSAGINSRTSLIVVLLGIILLLFTLSRKSKNTAKSLFIISILIIPLYLEFFYVKQNNVETFNWIIKGYDEIIEFFKGEHASSGYFSYLSSPDFYPLPEVWHMIFGTGTRIMTPNQYNVLSDIGYISDIWLGGIVFSVFLYYIFGKMLADVYRAQHSSTNIFTAIFFMIVLLLANFKGYIFYMNNITTLFFIIFSFYVLSRKSASMITPEYGIVPI